MKVEEFKEKFSVEFESTPIKRNLVVIKMEIDENDGDYIRTNTELSLEDFQTLLPVLRAIESGEFNSTGDSKRDDYILPTECENVFYDIDPSGEYGGHSLCINKLEFYDEYGRTFDIQV